MDMVFYSTITYTNENISARNNKQYGRKYDTQMEEVVKGQMTQNKIMDDLRRSLELMYDKEKCN